MTCLTQPEITGDVISCILLKFSRLVPSVSFPQIYIKSQFEALYGGKLTLHLFICYQIVVFQSPTDYIFLEANPSILVLSSVMLSLMNLEARLQLFKESSLLVTRN